MTRVCDRDRVKISCACGIKLKLFFYSLSTFTAKRKKHEMSGGGGDANRTMCGPMDQCCVDQWTNVWTIAPMCGPMNGRMDQMWMSLGVGAEMRGPPPSNPPYPNTPSRWGWWCRAELNAFDPPWLVKGVWFRAYSYNLELKLVSNI